MPKGRTQRIRKKRKHKTKVEGEIEKKNIELCKWLKKKFNYKAEGLKIRPDESGGNGVFAAKSILPGEVMISVPKRMMIGIRYVICHSPTVRSLLKFLEKLQDDEERLTTVQILAVFLIEEKRLFKYGAGDKNFGAYISTLPQTFTHLLYWSNQELSCLPPDLYLRASSIRKKVTEQFEQLNELLLMSRTSNFSCHNLHDFAEISWSEFIWAWCCINTRCVYSDHESNGVSWSSKAVKASREDNYYLIPFLDMLNHHPAARVEANFNKKTQRFEVISFSHCRKYDQLFIKYGEHGSLDLLFEYGFVPDPKSTRNLNDGIKLSFQELCQLFGVKDPYFQINMLKMISGYKLHSDLSFIIDSGPSWSMVVCSILLASQTLKNDSQTSSHLLTVMSSGRFLNSSLNWKSLEYIQVKIEKVLLKFFESLRKRMELYLAKIEQLETSTFQMISLCRYLNIMINIIEQNCQSLIDRKFCKDFVKS